MRKQGVYFPIEAEAGTPEFDMLYWQILRGRATEARRSWALLIDDLRKAEKWRNFSPRYRQDLEPVLLYLGERIGSKDVKLLRPVHIYQAMDANRSRTRFANYIPVAVSLLAELGKCRGWLDENPAKDIERAKVPEERRKPHLPWSDEAVAKMRQQSAGLPRLIFEIGLATVQRPSDWLRFTWGDYDGETLRITQSKTGARLKFPCTRALQDYLGALIESMQVAPPPDQTIIAREDGSSLTYHTMARVLRNERKRLDIEEFDLHGLRYRGVQELARAGCSDDEIASYSGHYQKSMIVKYAGEARKEMNAIRANRKRDKHGTNRAQSSNMIQGVIRYEGARI